VHRLPAQCKVLAAFLFVVAVVATPRETFWAYGIYLLLLVTAASLARVPLAFVSSRLVVEVPFVLFALLLPLVGRGEQVVVLGIPLSVEGSWAAWNILVKATLGLGASILLGASTPIAEILHGLEHLRMPRVVTSIAAFMIRYADVITGEMNRMKIARESRAYNPRWFWQARALAATAGTLFIRSYERGERVYLAMVSRGYAGSVPVSHDPKVPWRQWAGALSFPILTVITCASAWALS
jgi:cobalt/nickel transport system permease protein